MAKKSLDTKLDDELYKLHVNCWAEGRFRNNALSLYLRRILDLDREGFDVAIHKRFISYYIRKKSDNLCYI